MNSANADLRSTWPLANDCSISTKDFLMLYAMPYTCAGLTALCNLVEIFTPTGNKYESVTMLDSCYENG